MYYQPSGKIPVSGIVILVLLAIVAFPILSIAYTYATWYIPYIYIKFFLTVGFGLGLMYVINKAVMFGKIRNPKVVKIAAFIGALIALYIHWCLYFSLILNAGESHEFGSGRHGYNFTETAFNTNSFIGLLINPQIVMSILGSMYDLGSFSIFGFTPTGIVLAIFWLIEALIIIGIPVIASSQASEPFSEVDDKWMSQRTLSKKLPFFTNIEELKTSLENSNFNSILGAEISADTDTYAKIKTFSSEGDTNQYISIYNYTKKIEKDKEDIEEVAVLENLHISNATMQNIISKFD